MRRAWLLAAAVGCGGKMAPEEYANAFLSDYCVYWLECSDQAQLAFDGTNTEEACLAINGPKFEAQWKGCKLDQKRAEQCLAAMGALTCPVADGADLDASLPIVCTTVWEKCVPQPAGTTPTVTNPDEEP